MSILGFTKENLEEKNGYITGKEIQQQPELWLETVAIVKDNLSNIKNYLSGIDLKTVKIVFTGAGTSEFIGKTLAPYMRKTTGLDIESRATTDIVANPEMYLPKDKDIILISFARSGNSPESVGTVEIANKYSHRVKHIFITCNPEGKLAEMNIENKMTITMPKRSNDLGFAMTGSFSCMLLAGYSIFNLNNLSKIEEEIKLLAVESAGNIKKFDEILHKITESNFERVVTLGSGALCGLAEEISLKMLELCAGKITTFSNTPMGFRHGPKSIVNGKTLIILLMSNNEYSRKYDLDLLQELKNDNKALEIIVFDNMLDNFKSNDMPDNLANNCNSENQASSRLISANFISENDILTSLSYLIPCQTLAFFKSLEQNMTPDNPCPTGEVNRVVKGVIIHEYK